MEYPSKRIDRTAVEILCNTDTTDVGVTPQFAGILNNFFRNNLPITYFLITKKKKNKPILGHFIK